MESNSIWASARPTGYGIVNLGHPALRTRALPVPTEELGSAGLAAFLEDMTHTLRESNGVGLAAPQVGVSRRLFITHLPEGLEERYLGYTASPLQAWINPSWEALDDDEVGGMEGCLSIPHYTGRVMRPERIRAWGLDHHGEPFEQTLEGRNARVFLHEWDHLEGILYLDRLALTEEGHPELYHKESWLQIEAERRAGEDHAWLNARGFRT